MPSISFKGTKYQVNGSETVLECLERHGLKRPSSCRAGSCQTCMMKVVDGVVPSKSYRALSSEDRAKKAFLPCMCSPTSDITVDEAS